MKPSRWLAALVLLAGMLCAAPAVAASKGPSTRLALHVSAASSRIGTPVALTGTVTPSSLKQVAIEALTGGRWVVIGHAKPTGTGSFALSVKAPRRAGGWRLRAVRAKSAAAAAGLSAVLTVRVVKTAYVVVAKLARTVAFGALVVATGKVSPRATGAVRLQTLVGTLWKTLGSAKLTKASTFAVSGRLAPGVHSVRVTKAASSSVATGFSAAVTLTVALPPVVVTTTSLPNGTVGLPYSQTLSATGGVGPYTWSVAAVGLPPGLSVSSSGVISGTVQTTVFSLLTVTATDAAHQSTQAQLSLQFVLSPAAGNVVKAWGYGNAGSLGGTASGVTSTPVTVPGLTGAVAVTGSYASGFALRFDGSLLGWGSDGDGELGDNGAVGVTGTGTPQRVNGLPVLTAVVGGEYTVYALAADGTVWAWGNNLSAQIGDETEQARLTPVQVHGLTGVVQIAAGDHSGFALRSDGTVWSWGSNAHGVLGTGNPHGVAGLAAQLPGLAGVVSIGAAGLNAAAVTSDGAVYEWGQGSQGQLGFGPTVDSSTPLLVQGVSGVTKVAVTSSDTFALTATGTLFAWGSNSNGQLGDGATTASTAPVHVRLSGVASISAGASPVTAVLAGGTVWSWGAGAGGLLGDGAVTDSDVPVQVGDVAGALSTGDGSIAAYAIQPG